MGDMPAVSRARISAPRFVFKAARNSWLSLQARTLRRLAGMARRGSKLPAHLQTGIDGEREAIFYLRSQDYTVVARRWRNPKLRGDLDLIAWDGHTLCFVEIKTRSRRNLIPAEMAVDSDKQETLRRLALSYIRRLPKPAHQAPVRFDVLSVYLEQPQARRLQSLTEPKKESVSEAAAYLSQNDGPDFVLNKGAFQWA
jgi:putative endonuclease